MDSSSSVSTPPSSLDGGQLDAVKEPSSKLEELRALAIPMLSRITGSVKDKIEEEKEEAKIRRKLASHRKSIRTAFHVTEPPVLEIPLEREYRRIATKGVVAVFNAVKAFRAPEEQEEEEEGEGEEEEEVVEKEAIRNLVWEEGV
ncbi:hypothetical protein Pmar_PMAR026902 [Perkinsus marinus ATCC 50983]|uniref:RRP15-like protein n=1 Tax=Perkinsus marinus (strain ATCC 50983 / TXsc) TaxID=423536 RepID=C5LUS6_PERM5|nr:hypothetical protein Pmar_PMAR026902 [Perkinsus marinus ATCC 50983]EEQ99534.1 hypothetical protein Pmar_PMAR026902 [Perkinsus marinus ATCC 50983]|eukprot:XP_002766817.1 hypothetical protein Pmar_PMAR026902 [Perkinsus marinus ATCC 50983]